MKQIKLLSIVLFLFFLFACQSPKAPEYSVVKINSLELNVEVVTTPELTAKGLSGRASLCWECGMLFEFSDYQIRNFWMKDMQFPLDIIWIKDNQIIGINEKVLVNTNEEITRIQSPEPVNMVLEVNAGWTESNNIKTGDWIDII